MDRFYKKASAGPALHAGGFAVLLDQRPMRTPGRAPMIAPTQALAEAVAGEWNAQGPHIAPETMPLTQLLTTAIDRKEARAGIESEILKYLDSDLLCYRTDQPESLAVEQDAAWGPWLAWFERRFGAALGVTSALARLDQPKAAHKAAGAVVAAMDIHAFTAFQTAGALSGSLVLALALHEAAITPDEAWRCALCEELFYERIHDLEKHGPDPIEDKRRNALKRDLAACAAYFLLIKPTRS